MNSINTSRIRQYSSIRHVIVPVVHVDSIEQALRNTEMALGIQLLAIASGITAGIVSDYLPIADAFLVATGVSNGFTELDPAKVVELVRRVRDAN